MGIAEDEVVDAGAVLGNVVAATVVSEGRLMTERLTEVVSGEAAEGLDTEVMAGEEADVTTGKLKAEDGKIVVEDTGNSVTE